MDKIEKGMLIGMYFAKFENSALSSLGFENFNQAFNVISLITFIKTNSLRNYRDEFAPFFPTERKGWHKRPMYESRKSILEKYFSLELTDFTNLVKSLVYDDQQTKLIEDLEIEIENTTFAKRQITGLAAENYFFSNYNLIEIFKEGQIKNTTNYGCGFDFQINLQDKSFYAIEVKGLAGNNGTINLTQKEYKVAEKLKNNYFVFVVKGFDTTPNHIFYRNPVFNSGLEISAQTKQIIQTTYSFCV